MAIINKYKQNDNEIIGSPVLDIEIEQIRNIEKQEKVRNFHEETMSLPAMNGGVSLVERRGIKPQGRIKIGTAHNRSVCASGAAAPSVFRSLWSRSAPQRRWGTRANFAGVHSHASLHPPAGKKILESYILL